MAPPNWPIMMVSIKNWVAMVRRLAPKALRTPISRVRSLTLQHDIHEGYGTAKTVINEITLGGIKQVIGYATNTVHEVVTFNAKVVLLYWR